MNEIAPQDHTDDATSEMSAPSASETEQKSVGELLGQTAKVIGRAAHATRYAIEAWLAPENARQHELRQREPNRHN